MTYTHFLFALCLYIGSLNAFSKSTFSKNLKVESVTTIQDELERTLQLIQLQFKTNAVNKCKVDLKGSKLIIIHDDGNRFVFDLDVIQEIKSEYDSGKYFLLLKVHSNSTLFQRDMVNVIYSYDKEGNIIERAVSIGVPFKTYQSAVTTRDLVRKLKKIVNS